MIASEFDYIMARHEVIFGKKISGELRTLCWECCSGIPSQFYKGIAGRLEDLEKAPANLLKTIRAIWYSLDSGSAHAETKGCADCDHGTIFVKRIKDGITTTAACSCATCRPTAEHKSTQAQLRAAGWTIDNPAKRTGNPCSEDQAKAWLRKIQQRMQNLSYDYAQEVPF